MLYDYLRFLKAKSKNLDERNAVKSLNEKSIKNNVQTIINFVNWLIDNIGIYNWNEIAQRDINKYHLNFDNYRYRVIVNNTLLNFFEFALKKQVVLSNPVDKLPYKEYPVNEKNLEIETHKDIYLNINLLAKSDPKIALIAFLIYFHGLTTKEIINIKISDIDIERKLINIPNRVPVYLGLEIRYLVNYLEIFEDEITSFKVENLFYTLYKGRVNKVNKSWLNNRIKNNFNVTCFRLRRMGLIYIAEKFGAQHLHDCLGISWTHMSRFGNTQDNLTTEILEDNNNPYSEK